MAVRPEIAVWEGVNASDPIINTATPPADGALLREAVAWPLIVSTTPYCGCAHLCYTDPARYNEEHPTHRYHDRYWGVPVAPGATHARLWLTRLMRHTSQYTSLQGPAGQLLNPRYRFLHQSSTTQGGDSHPNISGGPDGHTNHGHGTTGTAWDLNVVFYFWPAAKVSVPNVIYDEDIDPTGDVINDSPSDGMPRQLELEPLKRSKIEPFKTLWVSAVTAWVSRQDDDMGA